MPVRYEGRLSDLHLYSTLYLRSACSSWPAITARAS